MRKKSHILLAGYLADQMPVAQGLQAHRKAFCLGSILPDIKPTFLTTRHEFFGTFETIQDRIQELIEWKPEKHSEHIFWRRFGEVIHYIADYFTFPHNKNFHGSFLQHNEYEKNLKNDLKAYIKSGKAGNVLEAPVEFRSFRHLIDYITTKHAHYMKKERSIKEDIHFIINVCFQVVQGILRLFFRHQMPLAAAG